MAEANAVFEAFNESRIQDYLNREVLLPNDTLNR